MIGERERAEGAEVGFAICSLHKCFLTPPLLSATHNNSHLWNVFLWNHTHSVLVPCGKSCVYARLVILSLGSFRPHGCKTGLSPGPLCHFENPDKNKGPSNLLAAEIQACVVCQSTFIWMQVLNSYLGLHIAAIMITALANHKTHIHREHTDSRTYSITHNSQAYSLYRSFISLTYTFPRLKPCPKSLPIYYMVHYIYPWHFIQVCDLCGALRNVQRWNDEHPCLHHSLQTIPPFKTLTFINGKTWWLTMTSLRMNESLLTK